MMTREEFLLAGYLTKKFYINYTLKLKFKDMAKIHRRTESAIIQALLGKIPTLLTKIINSKYMKLK